MVATLFSCCITFALACSDDGGDRSHLGSDDGVGAAAADDGVRGELKQRPAAIQLNDLEKIRLENTCTVATPHMQQTDAKTSTDKPESSTSLTDLEDPASLTVRFGVNASIKLDPEITEVSDSRHGS